MGNARGIDKAHHPCDALAAMEAELLVVERAMSAAQRDDSVACFDL
jgi:hypothetical protein